MLRISLIMILTGILAGCANVSTPTIEPEATVPNSATQEPISPTTEPQGEATSAPELADIQEYPVPPGTHPHDVAPALDGT